MKITYLLFPTIIRLMGSGLFVGFINPTPIPYVWGSVQCVSVSWHNLCIEGGLKVLLKQRPHHPSSGKTRNYECWYKSKTDTERDYLTLT